MRREYPAGSNRTVITSKNPNSSGRARELVRIAEVACFSQQGSEVALVVPTGTTPSGEIAAKTFDGGLYATASVHIPIGEYAVQWRRTGNRMAP